MTKKESGKFKRFLTGATWGGIAGVIVGVLFAPKKGEETREEVKTSIDKLKGGADKTKGKLKEVKKDVEEKLPDIKAKVKSKVKEIKSKAKKEVTGAKDALEKHLADKALKK